MRLGVVLSAGGLRGVAHLGVLRRLRASGIPIDVLVGVSAGAIIAGFHAAVGLDIEEMIGDAPNFKGRHLFMHGLLLRSPVALRPFLRRFCGIIPTRLRQLDEGRFDRLHHGVKSLGIVCHDVVSNQPLYLSSDEHHGVPLGAAVKGSAAVPRLIPTRPSVHAGRRLQLVDGGVSDSLPWQFARDRLGATHLIVSDCRRVPGPAPTDPTVVYIRPELESAPVLRSPAGTLVRAVAIGEAACAQRVIDRIRSWGIATGPPHDVTDASSQDIVAVEPTRSPRGALTSTPGHPS
jgi:predicted acylesterase/phospholipase RssA